MERERLWCWLHPLRVTQQYLLASMAAWFSSTVTPPPQSPPSHPLLYLFSVNSSPCSGISPQSLNSSSQPLHLPGDLCPCLRYVWLQQGLLILIPFRLPQINCFTLSLKCFSSDPDNCPNVVTVYLLQFSHPWRAGPVLLTLLFFPWFLHPIKFSGSIYSFLLVRYSCQLSAGVLQALLCLKMYS